MDLIKKLKLEYFLYVNKYFNGITVFIMVCYFFANLEGIVPHLLKELGPVLLVGLLIVAVSFGVFIYLNFEKDVAEYFVSYQILWSFGVAVYSVFLYVFAFVLRIYLPYAINENTSQYIIIDDNSYYIFDSIFLYLSLITFVLGAIGVILVNFANDKFNDLLKDIAKMTGTIMLLKSKL